MKKVRIEVLDKSGKLIEVIYCKTWMESIGNFNPMFCRYNGRRTLVQSKEGDISDPFRRGESYLNSLYITIKENN